jgi:hypothetical protein
MPHYHIIIHGDKTMDDPEGHDLPDDQAALAEGAEVARELVRDCGPHSQGWWIEIREGKRLVTKIDFYTVQ